MKFPRVRAAEAGAASCAKLTFAYRTLAGALALLAVLPLLTSGCGRGGREAGLSERVVPLGQPVPKGGGVYKLGNPYQVSGRWYTPREDANYDRVGIASWYGELFHGRRTANGEIYDMTALSAAHPTLPLPSYARVTNLSNGRTMVVRVNDRGPYANNRIIDLSQRSAELLGFRQRGTTPIRVTYVGPAPLSGDDSYERNVLASQTWLQYASAETKKLAGVTPVFSTTIAKTPPRSAAPAVASAGSKPSVSDAMTVGSIPAGRPAPPREPAEPDLKDPVFVQAGTFRDKDNAERLRNRLAELGPVDLLPASVSGTNYYRVRMGPFARQEIVDEALRQAEAAGAVGARVTTN